MFENNAFFFQEIPTPKNILHSWMLRFYYPFNWSLLCLKVLKTFNWWEKKIKVIKSNQIWNTWTSDFLNHIALRRNKNFNFFISI